ncbi:MAG: hypothetical protein Q7T40_08990 [Methylobacter sp.]|nr:hypothetical protein [Methylobacter sp.]
MALMVFCGRNANDGVGGVWAVVHALINKLMANPVIARDGVYAVRLPGAGAAIARDGVYAVRLLGAGAANAGFKYLMFTVLTPVLTYPCVAADKSIP